MDNVTTSPFTLFESMEYPALQLQDAPKTATRNKIATGDANRDLSEYPANSLTPEKLARLLKEADAGDVTSATILYEQVLERDSRISSGLQTRRLAASGREWEVLPGDVDSKEHIRHAEFIEYVFNRLPDFDLDLVDILDGLGKGFSCSEIVWGDKLVGGDFAGLWPVIDLEFVRQTQFTFDSDNLREPRFLTSDSDFKGVPLSEMPYKWAYFQDRSRTTTGNRAGLLRPLVWLYLFKNFSLKDWSIFSEVYGMPMRLGKYGPGATEDDQKRLFKTVISMGRDNAGVIPEGSDIDFITGNKVSGDGPQEKLINYCNREISILLLGHTGSAEGTPGRLGGETNAQDIREDILKSDVSGLESTLGQVIVALIDLNFGVQTDYPRIKFTIAPPLDTTKEIEKDTKLINLGLPVSRESLYSKYDLVAPQNEADTLEVLPVSVPGVAMSDLPSGRRLLRGGAPRQSFKLQDALDDYPPAEYYHQQRARAAFSVMREDLESQINGWDTYAEASSLLVSTGSTMDLGVELFEQDMISYLGGRYAVRSTALRRRDLFLKATQASIKLQDPAAEAVFDMPYEEAVEWFLERGTMSPEAFAALEEAQKARHFTLAKGNSDEVLKRTQLQLGKAIEEGQTLAEFKRDITLVWDKIGITDVSDHYTELVFNQNLSTAYHAGHYEQTFDPVLAVDFPFLKYNALLDNTRPTHEAMHNRVFAREDPIWNIWYPTNGFNCHCSVLLMSREEAEALGVVPETEAPSLPGANGLSVPVTPDLGFANTPSQMFRSTP